MVLLSWVERKNFTTAAATIQALPGTASVFISSTPLAVGLATRGRKPVSLNHLCRRLALVAVGDDLGL